MKSARSHDPVLAARRQFFEAASMPEDLLAPAVLRSWARCAELGLDAHGRPSIEPLSQRELNEARERHEVLRRVARPQIAALRQEASASDSIVILTDPDGLVLDAAGDAAFAGRAAKVALAPGVRWSETATGTNAIGTALSERRPVQILGAEHYFDPHRVLSCWAAPIFGPHGDIVGVLDVSAPALAPPHELALVRLATEQIEHRLFEHGFEDCDVVRLHTDKDMLGSCAEGVLVFSNERLVAANRTGLKLIQANWSSLNTRTAAGLFSDRLAAIRASGRISMHTGATLHARLDGGPGATIARAPAGVSGAAQASPHVFDDVASAQLEQAARLIDAGLCCLVEGEAGVGKEVFVRAALDRSTRRGAPLHVIACSDGFNTDHCGEDLVLFDGVDALESRGQAAMTEWLRRRDAGGVIATARSTLSEAVESGAFDGELYYRLAPYVFSLRPVRAARDPVALVDALWRKLAPEGARFAPECRAMLAAYAWPGNLRQLAATLAALAALHTPGQTIGADLLAPHIRKQQGGDASNNVREIDRVLDDAMRGALAACNGNVAAAARRLGVHRSTFYRRDVCG